VSTTVAVLTPPGTGAIATLEVAGPRAWEVVRSLFRPAGGKLPELPELHRTWFGTIGDEVVIAVHLVDPELVIEIHSHGGPQVVNWLLNQFQQQGCGRKPTDERPWGILQQARTTRTAAILLDQLNGAFANAVRSAPATLPRLAALASVGRHLVEPWKVVIAGPPNVGKSSLVNAVAGYQRSVVSPTAGTTRDVVTTFVALDGWPVELADTAGLRRATESLESEGIVLARRFLQNADLVVWLLDATDPNPVWPTETQNALVVVNKADRPLAFDAADVSRVSAATGDGVPQLIAEIVRRLVPVAPSPGEAVPYTPELADLVVAAAADPERDLPRLVNFVQP
jgi:tRNA modification GTPase